MEAACDVRKMDCFHELFVIALGGDVKSEYYGKRGLVILLYTYYAVERESLSWSSKPTSLLCLRYGKRQEPGKTR